jgi:hypothetical protein
MMRSRVKASKKNISSKKVAANYKDREKQAGEPLKKAKAADGWIAKAEADQKTISQIIYCPLSRDVIQNPDVSAVWSLFSMGTRRSRHRITPHKYCLLKRNFPWEPGEKTQKY